MTAPGWVNCPYCHAISLGAPPHGQGQPCPMKVATEIAYVRSLEAAAAAHNRSGFAMNDMTEILKKMTGTEDDE